MGKRVLFCNCGGEIVEQEIKKSIAKFLENSKVDIIQLNDLCSLCVVDKESVKQVFSPVDSTLVIACHPRAVKKLINFADVEEKDKNITYLNLRDITFDAITKTVNDFCVNDQYNIAEISGDNDWQSWYPVIDYSRCTACGQCADFCLFGVYEKADGKVRVVNPKGCKNNCPACARICPQTAIIFPKYKQGGAISGSDSIDEIAEQQRLQQDMNSILGNDIYKALEQRKAKRQSIIKADAMKKAIEERDKARGNE